MLFTGFHTNRVRFKSIIYQYLTLISCPMVSMVNLRMRIPLRAVSACMALIASRNLFIKVLSSCNWTTSPHYNTTTPLKYSVLWIHIEWQVTQHNLSNPKSSFFKFGCLFSNLLLWNIFKTVQFLDRATLHLNFSICKTKMFQLKRNTTYPISQAWISRSKLKSILRLKDEFVRKCLSFYSNIWVFIQKCVFYLKSKNIKYSNWENTKANSVVDSSQIWNLYYVNTAFKPNFWIHWLCKLPLLCIISITSRQCVNNIFSVVEISQKVTPVMIV